MAQADYFLKLEGVEGETSDQKHRGEIEIESWSWGETQPGTGGHGGGSGVGKVQPQDFHFMKRIDKASPVLMIGCATGQHFKSAVLTGRKAGGGQQEYLKITMEECLISSYQIGGAAHSDVVPTDQVSLNFAKLELSYKEQKPDGSPGSRGKAKIRFCGEQENIDSQPRSEEQPNSLASTTSSGST